MEMLHRARRRRRLLAAVLFVGAVVASVLGWRPCAVAWKLKQGQAALALGDSTAALECFLAAERLDPRQARTQFLLARTYRRLGNAVETARRLQKAGELGFPGRRLERELTLAKAQAGLLAQVEPLLPGLLMTAGEDGPEICSAFVSGYVLNYEFEKAQRILAGWVGDYPTNAEPRIALGRIALHWQNLPEAESQFRLALKSCPEYRGLAVLLAQALVEQKKYQEALALLEKYRPRGGADDEASLLLADCLLNLGRDAEAVKVYAEIAGRSPENCAALLGLGNAKLRAGEVNAALESLNRALELCPRNLDVRYARAKALSLQGDRRLSQTELHEIATARAALTRAGELASEVLKKPDDLDARIEIGTTLMKYGDRLEGVAWLMTVLEFEPDHQTAHRLLADYYAEEGDEEQSFRHRRALTGR